MTELMLVMRNTFGWNGDHIETLRALGVDIHIATSAPAEHDPRFAGVVPVPPQLDLDQATDFLVDEARRRGLPMALTFYESDIVLTAQVNQALGHAWAKPEAEWVGRDKRLQREFLEKHDLPSPRSVPVGGPDPVAEGLRVAAGMDWPLVVKPSYLSASIGVVLAHDEDELRTGLAEIARLAGMWEGYFLADSTGPIALIEEFLPGTEVTLDGVALFRKFHTAGVTNKMRMDGPYFDEDFYTLPFRTPEEEPELTDVCQRIVAALDVDHCLLNAEFRKDAQGRWKVIEFSTRLSGGQNYWCLREVHAMDPVRLFVKAVLAGTDPALEDQVWAGELRRSAPRSTTCIKYAYRYGTLVRNNVGDVAHSPYFRSYLPAARPGTTLRRPPEGWYEIAGSLAIAAPYREPGDLDRVERIAAELDERLDIVVV
jgi:biotin carboxylase